MITDILYLLIACIVISGFYLWYRRKPVFAPNFTQRKLMNKPEAVLYNYLLAEVPLGWAVMSQVSYGAFLANRSFNRYMSVNSKRADFVVVNGANEVVGVVEYQGKGHFGSNDKSRQRAEQSDAIKRQALREAGIELFEIPAYIDKEQIQTLVRLLARPTDEEFNSSKSSWVTA